MAVSNNRLVSLDIFRGITVVFMIIVNTPGSWEYVYAPLRHAKWHGCTPTDLVFPFFLFIVGVSTYYSLKKYGSEFNWGSVWRIFRRMILIFAVGLLLAIFPRFIRDYSELRIPGVLQRIAIAYAFAAIICLSVRREFLWIVIAVILLAYWGLLYFFGGTDPYSLESNLVRKIDLALLGANQIYKGYGVPFDPEGLLSTLPAIATVLTGYFVGSMIDITKKAGLVFLKLILYGIAAAGLGYLWGLVLPINKPLWTSSYVMYSAGFAMITLALVYLIADVAKWQKWGSFFLVFGTNAIFAYTLAGLWTRTMINIKFHSGENTITLYNWIYQNIFAPVAGNMNGSLAFAVFQVLLVWSIVLILYRKKVFIKL